METYDNGVAGLRGGKEGFPASAPSWALYYCGGQMRYTGKSPPCTNCGSHPGST